MDKARGNNAELTKKQTKPKQKKFEIELRKKQKIRNSILKTKLKTAKTDA